MSISKLNAFSGGLEPGNELPVWQASPNVLRTEDNPSSAGRSAVGFEGEYFNFRLLSTILSILLCLIAYAVSAQAPPRYAVTDLCGRLRHSDASAYAINDKTEVVGVLDGHPFLWREGKIQVLNFSGSARAINNRSQVVGSIVLQTGSEVKAWKPWRRGFLYQNGVVRKLEVLPGGVFSGVAQAINVTGEIVGNSSTKQYNHATLYKNGQLTDLGVPKGFDSSAGTGINSSNQIVGFARRMTPPYPNAAFLWENGNWKLLSANVSPLAINDNGIVLGYKNASNANPGTLIMAFLLGTDGTQKLIGSFQPTAINNLEQVVGEIVPNWNTKPFLLGSPPKFIPSVAVLWQSGHLWHLDDLIPKNQGWQIVSAEGINNRGEIVGMGIHEGEARAVLLRPSTK